MSTLLGVHESAPEEVEKQMPVEAVTRRIETADNGGPIRVCACDRYKENRGPKKRQFVGVIGVVTIPGDGTGSLGAGRPALIR